MLDIEGWSKKQNDKIFLWLNIDSDPIYTPKFKRFIKFIAYKLNPFILNVASFILLVWILNRINTKYGIEKAIIIGIVIIIFTLRSIGKAIANPEE